MANIEATADLQVKRVQTVRAELSKLSKNAPEQIATPERLDKQQSTMSRTSHSKHLEELTMTSPNQMGLLPSKSQSPVPVLPSISG